MGANAQRRREAKEALKVPDAARAYRETRTMERLRARCAQITTLQQFEEIILTGHPDDRGRLRKMIGDLLKPGLPCCGAAILAAKVGRTEFSHGHLCPTRNLVKL